MITKSRTMPESDFTPEDSRDRLLPQENDPSTDELLNLSELQTVLDMLGVMETVEELSQLQALTEAQKRQVWEATPESLKQKLWQLRNQPASIENSLPATAESPEDEIQESETESDLDEDEIEDLGQDLELTADSYLSTEVGLTGLTQLELSVSDHQAEPLPAEQLTAAVGDRVILKAHPRLTASELKAIWELKQIQGSAGEVYDASLGTRIYPLDWLVVYSKTESEPTESELIEEDLDSEEAF